MSPLGRRASWFLGAVLASPVFAQGPVPRQVAAPASDIVSGVVRLPDPASTPTTSRAAIVPLAFVRSTGGWTADVDLPVEQDGTLALALLSPAAATWKLLGGPATDRLLPVEERYPVERTLSFAGDALPGWVVDRRDVGRVAAGPWRLRIEAPSLAEGWLVASADPGLRLQAYVASPRLVAGTGVALVARVEGAGLRAVERAIASFSTRAVTGGAPGGAAGAANGGATLEVALRDDGLHEDGAANDGLYGAFVPDALQGDVTARVEFGGALRSGARFLRSALVAFPMHEPRLVLDGTARATALDAEHLRFAIGAFPLGEPRRLHVSAEVWGRDASGAEAPVCWLSKQLAPEVAGGAWELPLALDLDWLEVSGVGSPLELRQVRVQDPDTEAVLDLADEVALATSLQYAARPPSGSVTPRMLTGNAAATIGSANAPPQNYAALRALMLVHGYCSSGSIWPAADFTQPKLEFLDPNQNRTHDQFAQWIAQSAASARKYSFGVVAHSQGGPASLHLLTYYQSGLDEASGGRRIQSVAAPYQGTPLASWGGFACGVNNNMTPSGSATWLAGIPSWARAEVYTWTTSNSGSACNALTSLLLTDPEDGTVEKFRSELPGGNNLGHTVGWCHTTGMSNPANYTDSARNMLMNAAASR